MVNHWFLTIFNFVVNFEYFQIFNICHTNKKLALISKLKTHY